MYHYIVDGGTSVERHLLNLETAVKYKDKYKVKDL